MEPAGTGEKNGSLTMSHILKGKRGLQCLGDQ